MAVNLQSKLEEISKLMDPVIEDRTVPRNIRTAVEDSKKQILDKTQESNLSISTAIYTLDEIVNDINMPFHIRTGIWGIISELEKLKEELK